MKTKVYEIEGMTCASCANAVQRATKKLDGVSESNVNYATEKLNIDFDESKVSEDDILKAVEKAGYKVVSNVVKSSPY